MYLVLMYHPLGSKYFEWCYSDQDIEAVLKNWANYLKVPLESIDNYASVVEVDKEYDAYMYIKNK
jgi:hypothetical protein